MHPNDHVNMGQSTNDVFPTAMQVAALVAVETHPRPVLADSPTLERKAREFADVVKAGRTHLQDAVPMTLGQEFSGYASVISHGIAPRRAHARPPLRARHRRYGSGHWPQRAARLRARVVAELRTLTHQMFRRAENPFEALQNRDATP